MSETTYLYARSCRELIQSPPNRRSKLLKPLIVFWCERERSYHSVLDATTGVGRHCAAKCASGIGPVQSLKSALGLIRGPQEVTRGVGVNGKERAGHSEEFKGPERGCEGTPLLWGIDVRERALAPRAGNTNPQNAAACANWWRNLCRGLCGRGRWREEASVADLGAAPACGSSEGRRSTRRGPESGRGGDGGGYDEGPWWRGRFGGAQGVATKKRRSHWTIRGRSDELERARPHNQAAAADPAALRASGRQTRRALGRSPGCDDDHTFDDE